MKRLKRGMDIEMNLAEFNVLYEVYKEGSVIYQNIVRNTGYESEQVSKVIEGLREKGWIESGITKKGYEELEQYRVDNAIIMAAGFGIRSLPLSRVKLWRTQGQKFPVRQIPVKIRPKCRRLYHNIIRIKIGRTQALRLAHSARRAVVGNVDQKIRKFL